MCLISNITFKLNMFYSNNLKKIHLTLPFNITGTNNIVLIKAETRFSCETYHALSFK